eukprot:TRINITY_DN20109_c0_g1_i1.p1 TRINITY_DN20109_c0_g1~~TRINITY_DN20109_c0_g1_i1.p1  ORF type:complete len:135 (-),score=32.58 TRINITY_DN20109_c0_g1_i1:59-463(-)
MSAPLCWLGGVGIPGRLVPYYAYLPGNNPPVRLLSALDFGLHRWLLAPHDRPLWIVASEATSVQTAKQILLDQAALAGYAPLDVTPIFTSKLLHQVNRVPLEHWTMYCLLYTSDAADEEDSVDLGGRRLIKKKK